MFNLGKLAEEYLTYSNFKSKAGKGNLNLLAELNNRKLEKVFLKKLKETEHEIGKQEYADANYYYEKYELENIIADYKNWSRYKSKDLKDYSKDNIINSVDFFMQYFLIKILNLYAFLDYRKQYEQFDFKLELINEIINKLKVSNEYKDNLFIKTGVHEILMLQENNEKDYYILKDIFINRIDELTLNRKYNLHNQLQLFCTNMSYENDERFIIERFELYNIALNNKLYHGAEDIYFDDVTFGNITLVSLRLKKFDWVESFIEKYKSLLAPENRDIIVNFCLARLSFYRGKFENSLKILNSIKSIKHLQYKLAVRELTLLIYFELSLFNQAYSFLDAHRHFLVKHRETFSDIRFKRQQQFLKFYGKLMRLKEKGDKNELMELSSLVSRTKNVTERFWLLEKIKEMEK